MRVSRFLTYACLSSCLLLAALASSGHAAVIWDESVDGLLSSNYNTPTAFTLVPGISSVLGIVGTDGSAISPYPNANYQDFLSVTIPVGYQLSSYVCPYWYSPGGDDTGFTGVVQGPTFFGNIFDTSNYLGWTHVGTGTFDDPQDAEKPVVTIGVNLLPIMGGNYYNYGAQGFSGPLPSGTYTFLIQQQDADNYYQYDYGVTTVPEPGTLGLLVGGAILAMQRRRTRRA